MFFLPPLATPGNGSRAEGVCLFGCAGRTPGRECALPGIISRMAGKRRTPSHSFAVPALLFIFLRNRPQFKGTDRGSITVKLVQPSPIFRVHITNAGSQFIEMMGSKTEQGDDWEPIIHKAVLRTQCEIKEGKSRDRPRTFTTDSESVAQLSKTATSSTWFRLKIICSWYVSFMRRSYLTSCAELTSLIIFTVPKIPCASLIT